MSRRTAHKLEIDLADSPSLRAVLDRLERRERVRRDPYAIEIEVEGGPVAPLFFHDIEIEED